jgi:lipopolysaccharide export system permease protein
MGKGLEATVILEFFFYNIAWILAMAVPMAALIATLMAFGRLSGDHEITALKSGGVSLWRLLRPMLMTGLFLAIGLVIYNNWILPDFNYKSGLLRRSIFRKQPTMQMEESLFLFDVPDFVVHSKTINHESHRMYGVTIFDESKRGIHNTILADSADLVFDDDTAEFILILFHGQIHRRQWDKDEEYSLINFATSDLRIPARNMVLRRQQSKYRNDREQNVTQMLERIRRWEKHDAKKNERKIRSYWVEIHKKFSIPAAILIFIMIGAPLGVKSGSGNIAVSGGLSVLFFLIYWVFLMGGEDLADRGFVDPAIAMWLPNILMLIIGLLLLRSAIKEGTPMQLPAWIIKLKSKKRVLRQNENDREGEAMATLASALKEETTQDEKE